MEKAAAEVLRPRQQVAALGQGRLIFPVARLGIGLCAQQGEKRLEPPGADLLLGDAAFGVVVQRAQLMRT